MRGPPSSPLALESNCCTGRLRSGGSSYSARMSSPPRSHKLSRCVRRVLGERPSSSRCSRNGVKHVTRRCPGSISHGPPDQLFGQLSRSGQYCSRRSALDATIAPLSLIVPERPMLLIRLLNACHHFPGFVYERARLRHDATTVEVEMRPRRGSKPRCSGCHRRGAGYDRLATRRFEFIPLWGFAVVLCYAMRRVDCQRCGVKVEVVPWAVGKHGLTQAYLLFLAHWARKLSWSDTARSFHTSWDTVRHAVEYVVGGVGPGPSHPGTATGHRRGRDPVRPGAPIPDPGLPD